MTQREIYAACIYGCLSLLSLALGGLWGLILMNAGFWIGAIDLGWIDDRFDVKTDEQETAQPVEGDLPPNVVRLPVREFKKTA